MIEKKNCHTYCHLIFSVHSRIILLSWKKKTLLGVCLGRRGETEREDMDNGE